MKQFNYDLLEDRREQIKQDNSGVDGRKYHSAKGTYPSITSLLYEIISKKGIEEWKSKVGAEVANRVSTKASKRGTRIHGVLEKYIRGDENYFDKNTLPEHKELINLATSQIEKKIDNIRGIELMMWSDSLRIAGTTDLIADYEGELAIIDWKTASYLKKEEYLRSYILQGTAYSFMLYEMYGLIPKKIVICSLIRFDSKKYNHMLDADIHIDWRVYNPLDHIHELQEVCEAYHFKKGGNLPF
ncbi:MAG: hypothetical protein HOG73_09150 [Candidatus Marinimicrobia bacterium]|mgnify:CR=1 FL=1|jgi:hypothetical protein|nr:hypothetical protein [Candidatus Woesearchaeota archaeon]MBT5995874.1 hypothetical protein [Candidatus Neomarinimicrobiota bacterium]